LPAAASASPPPKKARPGSFCATGGSPARRPKAAAATPPWPRATAAASPSGSPSRQRSRCCCRAQSSRYYSEPQLATTGTLELDGRAVAVTGRAWLDHEWSDSFLDASAVGWDWIGMNLDDGSALTAFRLRRADGSTLWSGGSYRAAGSAVRDFADGEVVLTPGRVWLSPASQGRYPVEWRVATPAGVFTVRALQDDQELDSRASTGAVYWEGLSALEGDGGRHVGRGYLEMTGYAGRLVL
jgi:predicted secreted hydrolase